MQNAVLRHIHLKSGRDLCSDSCGSGRRTKMLLLKALLFVGALLLLLADQISVEGLDAASVGSPETNILRKEDRDTFRFTVYPQPLSNWGQGKNVADERQWLHSHSWPLYGFQAKADSEGVAYIQVDLKKPHLVRAFAVTGYAGGSHKPTGPFFLEGSTDAADWKMVAEGEASQWHAPGTFPFRPSQIIKAVYPNRYRYYRVIARGWTNGNMVIYNWGLFA